MASLARPLAVPVFIFAIVFLGYYISAHSGRLFIPGEWLNHEPLDWYKHFVFLAEAISRGTFDLTDTGIPDFYQDIVTVGGSKYLPYPPAPALVLLPFESIWGTSFSEVYFSMVLGAINAVLFWYLLGLLNVGRTTKLLLVPFFAFGTVHFYAATTGTLWFYNHVVTVTFLLLAIIFMLRRTSLLLPAFFLGLSFLSRQPTILATPFFVYWMLRQRHEGVFSREHLREIFRDRHSLYAVGLFGAALLPFVLFTLWYNAVRFDSPFETGFDTVANGYINGGLKYSFYLDWFPDAPRFNLFDIRNVPLHLYTIFLMPPEFTGDLGVFRPSPYGLSVLLTSPAFVYAALVKRKDALKPAAWLAIGLVSIPLLLHYSQGWVQYGYRFLLDFAPFLLILTALGFEDNQSPRHTRVKVALVAIAVLAGFWGRYWGSQLGW